MDYGVLLLLTVDCQLLTVHYFVQNWVGRFANNLGCSQLVRGVYLLVLPIPPVKFKVFFMVIQKGFPQGCIENQIVNVIT